MPLDLSKKRLSKIFYTLFLGLYNIGFRTAALFNPKAKAGIEGRKKLFSYIKKEINKPGDSMAANCIWMHCASLGEFEQGRPVLESIRLNFPGYKIVLTFFSASGYEAMKNYDGANHIFYLPFDGKANARKFVQIINPSLVLWVKYEYWFYFLNELRTKKIPVILISGIFRKGQPFFKWYGAMWRLMLQSFTHLFLQNKQSAALLENIGISKNITINGDTRFDRVIDIAENFEPVPLIEDFCGSAKVIVAGSTWEDDEAELAHFIKANPGIKFIIAPHEIDEENLLDVKEEFPGCIMYSELEKEAILPEPANKAELLNNVLIIDNVGLLSRLYNYATITYVGGGFGADGVHNVLEAAVYGKPVIYGPVFEKFTEAKDLVESGGGITIQKALDLETVLKELLNDEELVKSLGKIAKDYVYSHKGASKEIIQFIQEKRLLTN